MKIQAECEEQLFEIRQKLSDLEKILIEKTEENNKLKETVDTQKEQIQQLKEQSLKDVNSLECMKEVMHNQ